MSSTNQGVSGKSKSQVPPMDTSSDFDQFMSITLNISGTSTGNAIYVNLKSLTKGYPISWSLGEPSSDSSGLEVALNTAGSLPLSNISITPNQAAFQTASSGGGGNQWNFVVNCYLAGEEGLQEFELTSQADSSVTIGASVNNGKYHPITNAPTNLPWQPQGE
jgi:hypothetical protein